VERNPTYPRLRRASHGVARRLSLAVALLGTAALGFPLLGEEAAGPLRAAPGTVIRQAEPAICALLDNRVARAAMDGLHFNLLWSCGRQNELGKQPQPKADKVAPSEGSARDGASKAIAAFSATDVQANAPDVPAGFSSTQSETSITENSTNGTLCAAFNDSWEFYSGAGGFTGFARSTDQGASWQDGGTVSPSAFGDPSLVWRRTDGYFYLATLEAGGGLALWVSTDDCQSFKFVSIPTTSGDDKEILAVDNNPASPYYSNLYLIWTDFGLANWPIRVMRSTDGGVTWSAPTTLDTATGGGGLPVVQGGWLTVAPNGTVYAAWLYYTDFYAGPISIRAARSTNGGVTWTAITAPAVNVASPQDATASGNCGRPALNGDIRYLASPQIAADKYGYLHVVYSYDGDGAGADDVNVYYRRSTNGGTSWGAEVRLNDDATTADQYQPTLAVADGQVMVTWYDRRDDATNNYLLTPYKRVSLDNGFSWAPSQRIGDVQTPVYLDPGLATCYHGDYDQSLWTRNNREQPLWSDDRNVVNGHNDPDVFTETRTGSYRCEVNITAGTHTCNGPISLTTNSGIYRVATVDLADGYVRLDAFVNFCNPTGYSTHLADSPTADGGGGDAGTTLHNAETYLQDKDFWFFGMDVPALATVDPTATRRGIAGTGCSTFHWTVFESYTGLRTTVGGLQTIPGSNLTLNAQGGFESAPYATADSEDLTSADANRWYVGLNRTVGSSARTGTGVSKACFVLSRARKVETSYVEQLCGIDSFLIEEREVRP
jgi:hypothetical protein